MSGENVFLLSTIIMLATFFVAVVIVTNSQTSDDKIIVYTTDKGIVCKSNDYYPKINCELIAEAVGPRLNTIEEK